MAVPGRSRELDPSGILVPAEALPPFPDDLLQRPDAGRLDVSAWFARREQPLEIEIGSGKGTFLAGQAAASPTTNFLGIEYEKAIAIYAADRWRRAGLTNVRLLCADAGEFLRWRVRAGAARVVHLYFPDPWPKAKHHRRRMVQDEFLAEVARVLPVAGELRVVTDHRPYWEWMRERFDRWTGRAPGLAEKGWAGPAPFVEKAFVAPPTARDGELVGTNFERKYRESPGSGGGGTDFFATVLARL